MCNDRYCTIEESIVQSMKEKELHKQGKIRLRSWHEILEEFEEWDREIKLMEDRFEYLGVVENWM